MNNILFTSDLHLGHKNILNFCEHRLGWLNLIPEDPTELLIAHSEALRDRWNSVVHERDIVWVLGDIAFNSPYWLEIFSQLKGTKYLVRGNHDKFNTSVYLKYFKEVFGLHKKYGAWLSHAPIHETELRGSVNLHGHCHSTTPHKLGDRYYDVGVDANDGFPVKLNDIREWINGKNHRAN